MKINNKGIDLLKELEGFRAEPYKDSVGIPTIGYGNTRYEDGTKVTMEDEPISEKRAEHLFKIILERTESRVREELGVTLSDDKFSSLVSFTYNVGIGAFRRSTLKKVIEQNPSAFSEIEREFMRWNKAGGRVIKGLINRRKKEYKLYSND